MLDDSQLMRQFVKEKDSGAFGALVERHVGMVYRAALRLTGGDAHQAEDVVQAVFILLARKAARLGGYASVAGWLYETTRRVARDVRRSEERRRRREEGAVIMSGLAGNGTGAGADEAPADWEKVRPVLDDALGELSVMEREAVLLRFFGGKTFGEIGAVLRLSEDAARMRVSRALEKLRGRLARRGVKSTAAVLGVLIGNDAALGAPAGLAALVSQSTLAGAGTLAVTGVAGILNTIKTVGAAAAVAVTAFVAVHEVRVKREADGELESVRQEYDALLAKMGGARAEVPSTASRSQEGVSKREPSEGPVAAGDAMMAAYPKVKSAVIAAHRASIAADVAVLYAESGLNAAQRADLEEILVAAENVNNRWSGGGEDIVFFIPAQMTTAEKERRMRAVLGEAKYAEIHSLTGLDARNRRAVMAAGRLLTNEVPLMQEQRQAFWQLFGQGSQPQGQITPDDWPRLLTQARTFLSEQQVEVLRRLQALEETL